VHRSLEDDKKKLLMLVTVGFLFCLAFAFVINRNPIALHQSDIYLRWYAIDKLFSDARDLYDSRNGEEVTSYAWGEQGYPLTLNFYYPAHLLVLIGPLALLPYPVAHLIWTVAGQIFYLAAVWLSMRLVDWPDSVNKRTAFVVAAALFIPFTQHTIWGQFNTIAVLSLVLCLYALRKGHHGLAGVFAIGFTFKPHTTVLTLAFLILWALFKRERWPFLFGFGLSALVTWSFSQAGFWISWRRSGGTAPSSRYLTCSGILIRWWLVCYVWRLCFCFCGTGERQRRVRPLWAVSV
jgi:hypothetical protein